jgi:apolipoprotein N-acyltransferase
LPTRAFDYARASASGVLLALSFPKYGHPACAWIALTPLLVSLASNQPRVPDRRYRPLSTAFSLGLLTGVIYFTGTLYWITRVMAVYGGLSMPEAVLINVALIAYQALFPAVFAIVVRRLVLARGPAALMAAPLVWVATELGRTYFLTGFPWVLLGYSQASVLPIAQLSSVFGVYGVSMLVAAVSAALAVFATSPANEVGTAKAVVGTAKAPVGTAKAAPYFPSQVGPRFLSYVGPRFLSDLGPRFSGAGAARWTPLVAVFAIVIAVAVWGSRRAAASEWTRDGEPIRVGMIQGNVDQAEKWDAARAASIFQDYLRLTRQAMAEGAEFVLWPESSIPFYFEEDPAGAGQVRTLARQARVPMLVGSDQIEWREENGRRIPTQFFNAAFMVREDGTTAGVYRKMHLVPFGEYVPLQRLLFFAAPLTQQSGTFSPGLTAALLPVRGHLVSVAICYEVVYPALVRQFVAGGSELLTTITNDAWFGATSAPYQHFEQASMRAVEEGRYLVRSANTGISGIVDPYGRVLAKTAIDQPAVLVGEARFLRTSTFYARHGDVLAYASVLMTVALLLVARRRVQ